MPSGLKNQFEKETVSSISAHIIKNPNDELGLSDGLQPRKKPTFVSKIPTFPSDEEGSQIEEQKQISNIPAILKSHPQRRILLVDDEPFNLVTLKDMIKLSPFKDLYKLLDTAKNGQDCLEKI